MDTIFEKWIMTRLEAHLILYNTLYLMQHYVRINFQLVHTNAPRLDRLTALLEGLSPKVTLISKANRFSLHNNPQSCFMHCQIRALLEVWSSCTPSPLKPGPWKV
jgi:hypothetical protein